MPVMLATYSTNKIIVLKPYVSERRSRKNEKEISIKPAYDHVSVGWPAQLTVSAFNRLGQYASSPVNGLTGPTVTQNSSFLP